MFAFVVLVTAVTLDISIRRAWESSLRDEIQRSLTARTRLFANRVEVDRATHSLQDIAAQEAQAAGARATIIDPTGKVLADSEADLASMNDAAAPLAFPSSTSPCLSRAARYGWRTHSQTSTRRLSASITHYSWD